MFVSAFKSYPSWRVKPLSSHTLRINLTSGDGLKFKLRLVSSC